MILLYLDDAGIIHYARVRKTGEELINGSSDEFLHDWIKAGHIEMILSAKKIIDELKKTLAIPILL